MLSAASLALRSPQYDRDDGSRFRTTTRSRTRSFQRTKVDVQRIESCEMVRQPNRKVREILSSARGPQHFRQRSLARKGHVLHVLWSLDVFRPDLCLCAEDVRGELRFEVSGDGFVRVNGIDR